MIKEVNILPVWIPEQMTPGSVFPLEEPSESGDENNPYVAALSCPECGIIGLIDCKQVSGLMPVICGSNKCSAQFFLKEEGMVIVPRKPF